jgi:hypothetical protein
MWAGAGVLAARRLTPGLLTDACMQRTFELLQPLWLLALVPGFAMLALAAGRIAGRSPWLRVCLKALCIACLAVALSSPRMACGRRQLCRIFVVDRSASVLVSPNAARECVMQVSSRMDPEDLVGVVSFARQPSVDVSPRKAQVPLPSTLFSSAVERESTDIESALRLAASQAPAGCDVEIVLLTDGNENAGYSRPAVLALARSGIRVSAVPTQRPGLRDARIERIDAPSTVRESEPFEITVTAGSTFNTKATLRVFSSGSGQVRSELSAVSLTLYPGRSAQVSASLPPQKEPVGTYEARL